MRNRLIAGTVRPMGERDITFSVQGDLVTDTRTPLELLERVEALGADAFYAGDHPGVGASPFVTLAAVGAMSEQLRLGTYVVNAGLRDPVQLAVDVATLDLLSGGRAILGLGAGHTPGEWTASGLAFPTPGQRVDRLVEVVDVVTALLAGEVVDHDGAHLRLSDAVLMEPRPVQQPVPLLIGGGGRRVLRLAGQRADIVGLTGLGRTLADGHRHEVAWAPELVDATVELVADAAREAGRSTPLVLEALVQHVELTDDREHAAHALADRVPGLSASDVLTAPYVLVGSVEEIADHLAMVRSRWGITRFVVRPPTLDPVEQVVARLRQREQPTTPAPADGPPLIG